MAIFIIVTILPGFRPVQYDWSVLARVGTWLVLSSFKSTCFGQRFITPSSLHIVEVCACEWGTWSPSVSTSASRVLSALAKVYVSTEARKGTVCSWQTSRYAVNNILVSQMIMVFVQQCSVSRSMVISSICLLRWYMSVWAVKLRFARYY